MKNTNPKENELWKRHSELVEKRRALEKVQQPDNEAIRRVDLRLTTLSELLNPRATRKPRSIAKRVAAFRLAGV